MYQLNRARVNPADIIVVYCSIIRSVLEYACPVWHCGLTLTQTKDIENVQRRCLRIIYPDLSYSDALFVSGLERLDARRQIITKNTFQDIRNSDNVINNLIDLYRREPCSHISRSKYDLVLPLTKTNRYLNSFFPYCIRNKF